MDIVPSRRYSSALQIKILRFKHLNGNGPSARGRNETRSYVGPDWRAEGSMLCLDKLNAQFHSYLPAQKLKKNFDSPLGIGRILNDPQQAIEGPAGYFNFLASS